MTPPRQLQESAQRRRQTAELRVEKTLGALARTRQPITFRGIAAAAGVSTDFLYRHPDLRARIASLREAGRSPAPESGQTPPSNVVRTLTLQLAEERRARRTEVAELRQALQVAHGELLLLRRELERRLALEPVTSQLD